MNPRLSGIYIELVNLLSRLPGLQILEIDRNKVDQENYNPALHRAVQGFLITWDEADEAWHAALVSALHRLPPSTLAWLQTAANTREIILNTLAKLG